MLRKHRALMLLRDPATWGLPALLGIYLFCLYLILYLPLILREAPEAYLIPVVLGQGLEFWISSCNILWLLLFAVHLGFLLQSGWRTQKVNVTVTLVAIAGLLIVESGMSLLFHVMAFWHPAQ